MNKQRTDLSANTMGNESEETMALFSERLDAATPCGEKAEEDACGTVHRISDAGAGSDKTHGNQAKEKPSCATDKIEEAVSAAADRARIKHRD